MSIELRVGEIKLITQVSLLMKERLLSGPLCPNSKQTEEAALFSSIRDMSTQGSLLQRNTFYENQNLLAEAAENRKP